MASFRVLNIILLTIVSSVSFGQKVKYKDLFSLLSTRQYEVAEPLLKTYLKDPKENNPNAFLYMGIIYHEKALADDVLRETELTLSHIDSALIFYNKAAAGINEKEIKKNKDYYSAYSRRDLRTGEFGVKESDVQLEIETKVISLKERADKVKMVKHYFVKSEELYRKSQESYKELNAQFKSEKELYLRANEAEISKLKDLSLRFDSCSKIFENYRSSLSNLGKTKYNQAWMLTEIKNFKEDGLSTTDFYFDNMGIWDYKKFASNAAQVIEKEVLPTRESLIKYDIELNKLRHTLESDSISVKSDLAKLVEKLLTNQLKKFDADPMPIDLFSLKIKELEYISTLMENKATKGGVDILEKLKASKTELKLLQGVDSIGVKIGKRNLDEDILNYDEFVKATFTKGDILKGYLKGMRDMAERQITVKKREVELYEESLKWLIVENDSVPIISDINHSKHKPLVITEQFTAGLSFTNDGLTKGYFYNIPPSHRPDVKVLYDVNPFFNASNKNDARGHIASDPGGQIFFILVYPENPGADGKYSVTAVKLYKVDGLSWSFNFAFDFKPVGISFNSDNGELVIKSDTEIRVIIDKTGKEVIR
jgi:phage anti-repressor protein